jgi:hypothetical protein
MRGGGPWPLHAHTLAGQGRAGLRAGRWLLKLTPRTHPSQKRRRMGHPQNRVRPSLIATRSENPHSFGCSLERKADSSLRGGVSRRSGTKMLRPAATTTQNDTRSFWLRAGRWLLRLTPRTHPCTNRKDGSPAKASAPFTDCHSFTKSPHAITACGAPTDIRNDRSGRLIGSAA